MTSTRSARIAIFNGPGQTLELADRPLPVDLSPGECLVEMLVATICGSDLHTWTGRRREPVPSVLGHEGTGRVIAVGEGRDPSLVGKRITWSLATSCGACRPCRDWSLPQKCERLFKYGHAPLDDGTGLNGGFASHLLLRPGTAVCALPDSIPNKLAATANCALATMVAVLEPLRGGGNLAVIQGAGMLGLFGCALLRSIGWRRIVVVDRSRERLNWVSEFGGDPAHLSAETIVEANSADAVIEVTGNSGVIPEGILLLRPGGHYALAGMVHPDSQLDLTGESIIRKCLTIRGTHNYTPAHLEMAVRFLDEHSDEIPWTRLISPPVPLSDLSAAFKLAMTGDFARIAVVPN